MLWGGECYKVYSLLPLSGVRKWGFWLILFLHPPLSHRPFLLTTTSQFQSMTVYVLQERSFFRFLSVMDSDLANRARLQECDFWGGTFHSACYPRKPRGGSIELDTKALAIRQ